MMNAFRMLVACVVTLLVCTAAHAVDGEYDPSWPGNGRIRLDISAGSDRAEALFIQPDGKVVISGTCGITYCAARMLANGSYDVSFGNTGDAGRFVYAASAFNLRLTGAAPTTDGGIVLAGTDYVAQRIGWLVKLDASGSLIAATGVGISDFASDVNVSAIAIQPDGKIVVAGQATSTAGSYDMFVARFFADLSRDTSFGDAGAYSRRIRFQSRNSEALALAIQPDGKIVVAGVSVDAVAVVRLLNSGRIDDDPVTGFGDDGRALLACGLQCRATSIAVDQDGSVLIAGAASGNTGPGQSFDFFVNRLTPRGMQAPDFGLLCPAPACMPGPAYFDWGNRDDIAFAMAVQPDGKILVSGVSVRGAGGILTEDLFALVRFDSQGNLDSSFGSDGQTRSWYGASAGVDDAKAIAIGNGGIMIAGFSRDAATVDSRFGVAKLKLKPELVFADSFE